MTVLDQVNDGNRYRFDQACRVKAINRASELGIREPVLHQLPAKRAIYKPEEYTRTTLEAARAYQFPLDQIIFGVTEGERVQDRPGFASSCESTNGAASRPRSTILGWATQD